MGSNPIRATYYHDPMGKRSKPPPFQGVSSSVRIRLGPLGLRRAAVLGSGIMNNRAGMILLHPEAEPGAYAGGGTRHSWRDSSVAERCFHKAEGTGSFPVLATWQKRKSAAAA